MSYQAVAGTWRDFLIAAAMASATLVGLLFVGLSLHLRAVLAHPEVRALARATLSNFALVLFLSLFLVIPQNAQSASTEAEITGAVSIVTITPSLLAASRSTTRSVGARLLVFRFAVSVLSYGATIAAGVLLGAGAYVTAFSAVLAVTMALLVMSLRSTWDLLVSLGEVTMTEQEENR